MAEKRSSLIGLFQDEGKSCQELITDAQRLFNIREKKEDGERLLRQAEEMRKKGLELIKAADAEEKKEKIIQQAIAEFINSDEDFIKENGKDSMAFRLDERERHGKTFVVIKGSKSEKQYMIFLKV